MFFTVSSRAFRCVHAPEFTNALFSEKCQPFQLAFLKMLSDYAPKTWKEIRKISKHGHYLEDYEKKRIGQYLGLTSKEMQSLVNNYTVCQIAIDEKENYRIFGILEDFANTHLFKILLFDPNHLFYYNPNKSQYPWGSEAICLFSKENCSLVNCQPSLPKPTKKPRRK